MDDSFDQMDPSKFYFNVNNGDENDKGEEKPISGGNNLMFDSFDTKDQL